MDLDNIKKTWQQAELKPTIGEEKIQKMLDNKGQSAFNSIIRYEKFGIIGLIICLLVAYPVFSRHMPVFYTYLITCLLGVAWQIYKFRTLKNANIADAGITDVAKLYYRYRKMIIKEFIVGLVWFLFFVILLGYLELSPKWGTNHFKNYLIIFVISMSIGILVGVFLYKKIYWNNLKRIEESLNEVEYFENENNK